MRFLGGRRIEQPACRPRAQVGTLAGPRNWPRSAQRNERPWHVLRKYKVSIGIQKLIPDLRPYRQETSNANQRDRLASIPHYVREVRPELPYGPVGALPGRLRGSRSERFLRTRPWPGTQRNGRRRLSRYLGVRAAELRRTAACKRTDAQNE